MTTQKSKNEVFVVKHLRSALLRPTETTLSHSRERVKKWFTEEAPLIQWGEMTSPLGPLFAAVNERGLCALDFGRQENEFLQRFDSRARLEKNTKAVQRVLAQLREYFAGDRSSFNLPCRYLTADTVSAERSRGSLARRIAPGQVWTYQRIAKELGRPRSSRPVGGALARNPIPIVIPCHRVIASDGSLGGYSGGSGLEGKTMATTARRSHVVPQPAPAASEYRASLPAIWSALIAVYIIWGSTYLAIRYAVETTPPFLMAAVRFIVSGAFYALRRFSGGDLGGSGGMAQRRDYRRLPSGWRQRRRGLGLNNL